MGWTSVELGDVCEFMDRRGVTPKKLGSDFLSSGFRVISAKNIKGRDVVTNVGEQRYVDKATYQKWMKSPLMPDDVLLTSEAPLGEPAYISDKLEWCLGQRLFGLRTDKSKLYGRFLFHGLQSNIVRQDLFSRATGATAQGIRQSELHKVKIPLPPIIEQKRIVAILDQAFADIDKARALTEQNLKNARELFESYLQQVFSQRGEGWVEGNLAEMCKIKHGFAFKSEDFQTDYDGDGPIILTPGNYTEDGELYFTEKNTKRCIGDYPKEFLFVEGELTIVMTDLSSQMKILGKPAFIGNMPTLHNQRIGKFEIMTDKISPRFLYYFLRSEQSLKNIRETATGTTVRHTAPGRILNIVIPFPEVVDQQLVIARKLDHLWREVQNLESKYFAKLGQLGKLKKSLLQKAFSGELTRDSEEVAA